MSRSGLSETDILLTSLDPQEIADGILSRVPTDIPKEQQNSPDALLLSRIRIIRNLAMWHVANEKGYNAETLEVLHVIRRRQEHLSDLGISEDIDDEMVNLRDFLYRARERMHHRLLQDPDIVRIVKNAYAKRERALLQKLHNTISPLPTGGDSRGGDQSEQ